MKEIKKVETIIKNVKQNGSYTCKCNDYIVREFNEYAAAHNLEWAVYAVDGGFDFANLQV